ncbi:MAG: DoxX family protein [Lysobacteraceae bacterium]|nr:MAG: DoxX family protein [Xanthomonadaceae bacterium]
MNPSRHPFSLPMLARFEDAALALMRLVVGAFLVWGVQDNVLDAERMQEFEQFLAKSGFIGAAFMARLSVWTQLLVGVAFIAGFATRWAGIVCAVHFVVAIAMVDMHGGIRASFPSACLVVIGLYLACRGAGRISIDHAWAQRAGRATAQPHRDRRDLGTA